MSQCVKLWKCNSRMSVNVISSSLQFTNLILTVKWIHSILRYISIDLLDFWKYVGMDLDMYLFKVLFYHIPTHKRQAFYEFM